MSLHHPSTPPRFQRHYPATPNLIRTDLDDDLLARDICMTLHLWPSEIDLCSTSGLRWIEGQLMRALREQRRRALAGHWSYDLACHARLLDLFRRLNKQYRGTIPPSDGHSGPGPGAQASVELAGKSVRFGKPTMDFADGATRLGTITLIQNDACN